MRETLRRGLRSRSADRADRRRGGRHRPGSGPRHGGGRDCGWLGARDVLRLRTGLQIVAAATSATGAALIALLARGSDPWLLVWVVGCGVIGADVGPAVAIGPRDDRRVRTPGVGAAATLGIGAGAGATMGLVVGELDATRRARSLLAARPRVPCWARPAGPWRAPASAASAAPVWPGSGGARERPAARTRAQAAERHPARPARGGDRRGCRPARSRTRAGVNQALVFYHFGSVGELVEAACRQACDDSVDFYRERFASVGSLVELLEVGRAAARARARCGQRGDDGPADGRRPAGRDARPRRPLCHGGVDSADRGSGPPCARAAACWPRSPTPPVRPARSAPASSASSSTTVSTRPAAVPPSTRCGGSVCWRRW